MRLPKIIYYPNKCGEGIAIEIRIPIFKVAGGYRCFWIKL
jgi:hypothetical protein